MLKKLFIAITLSSLANLPVQADPIFEQFDQTFLGNGSVNFNQNGASANGSGQDGSFNASFGPGGLNGSGSFDTSGGQLNGSFNNGNVNLSGPGGINGSFNSSGGTLSGPGGMNTSFGNSPSQDGSIFNSQGGSFNGGSSSGGGGGNSGANQGASGSDWNNGPTPYNLCNQMGPSFGKTTKQLVGQGPNGSTGVLQLPMCGTRGGGRPTLAPIFGY